MGSTKRHGCCMVQTYNARQPWAAQRDTAAAWYKRTIPVSHGQHRETRLLHGTNVQHPSAMGSIERHGCCMAQTYNARQPWAAQRDTAAAWHKRTTPVSHGQHRKTRLLHGTIVQHLSAMGSTKRHGCCMVQTYNARQPWAAQRDTAAAWYKRTIPVSHGQHRETRLLHGTNVQHPSAMGSIERHGCCMAQTYNARQPWAAQRDTAAAWYNRPVQK